VEKLKILLGNIRENKPLFITLICFGALIVILFSIFVVPSLINPDKVYHDPLSGETIYDPADRTPETYNTVKGPNYLGFSALVDRGVSFEDVETFKDKLMRVTVSGEKPTEISIDVDSINHQVNPDYDTYIFHIRINRKYDFQSTLKIGKSDDTVTYNFSGPNIDKVSFN